MKAQAKISDYDQQAIDFLESTGTEFSIEYLYTGKYFHNDKEARDIYQFTLVNSRGTYSAKFGDSINNTKTHAFLKSGHCANKQDYALAKKHGIRVYGDRFIAGSKLRDLKPSAYDVLACLNSYAPDTFAEFCDEYGYSDQPLSEHDSVMRTFLAVREETTALRKMFTTDQLDQLAEIA